MAHATERSRGLWIVPAALLVHNLEEALTIGGALPRLQSLAQRLVGRALATPSEAQFQLALVVLTVAAFGLLLLAQAWHRAAYALVVLQAVMTLNVASHLVAATLLGGYAPGVVTAVLVEAPTSWLVWSRLREAGWMTRLQWRLLPLLAVVLHGPGLVGLLAWARHR